MHYNDNGSWNKKRRAHTVFRIMEKKAKKNPPTIGAAGLNFSVRNGMRWNPGACCLVQHGILYICLPKTGVKVLK